MITKLLLPGLVFYGALGACGESHANDAESNVYVLTEMRIHIGKLVVPGIRTNNLKELNLSMSDSTREVSIVPGQKLPIKVEIVLSNGEVVDVTNDRKTKYHARQSVLQVVEKKYVVGAELDDRAKERLKKGMSMRGHLAIYYNLVDDDGRKLADPKGPVGAGVVWFSLVKNE